MDIQSLGLLSGIAAQGDTIVDNSIKCGDEFEKPLRQINGNTDIAEMSKFQNLYNALTGGEMAEYIRENFNVTLDVGSIGNCYDFLNNHDIRCTNYVRISPQTLQDMEKKPALKNKVLNAIKEFCSDESQMEIKALQPPVKSAGMMIYPDGRILYWLEGYPNEAENKTDKKIITDKQPIKKWPQRYSDMKDDAIENSVQNMLPVMVSGYKKRIK